MRTLVGGPASAGSRSKPYPTTDTLEILLAVDGSEGADAAVRYVAASLDARRTALEVVSVVPEPAGPVPAGAHDPAAERPEVVGRYQRDAFERAAHEATRALVEQGFEARATILEGHAAEAIVELAGNRRPDLLVLGTRGLSGRRLRLAGSVSTTVARYAPVSVLVVRTAEPVHRVLLGYDASPDADEAMTRIATLPWSHAVEVVVCSVYDVPRPQLPCQVGPEVRMAYRDVARWAREAAEVMAADAAGRLTELGLVASTRTARGKAHEQLAILASELPADLLAIGSHGLSAIQRFFLGSTSATLMAQPPTSVLVARGAPDAA